MSETQAIETMFLNIAKGINQRDKHIRLSIWENGRDLAGVRDMLKPKGLWIKWIEKHLTITRQTVDNYISIFEADSACQMVLHFEGNLADLYKIAHKPNPQLAAKVHAIKQKAGAGKSLTDDDMKAVLDNAKIINPEKRETIIRANQTSPETGRVIALSESIENFDGKSVSIHEADNSLIEYNARREQQERKLRQLGHIQDNTKTEFIPLQYSHLRRNGNTLIVMFENAPEGIIEFVAKVEKREAAA